MHPLIERYHPGSSLFLATPGRVLLAHGHDTVISDRGPEAPRTIADALASAGGDRIAVGAIPFDDTAPARLIVPQSVEWAPPLTTAEVQRPTATGSPVAVCQVRSDPSPEEYLKAVTLAVDRITCGELAKVVLARSLVLTSPAQLDVRRILSNLCRADPRCHTFALPLADGSTLVGSSPELLVSRRGDQVIANPLAGSAARSPDPEADRAAGRGLLASSKDRREHAVVIEAVSQALTPLCEDLVVPPEPSLVKTAALWHLSTRVTGTVADPSISALDLVQALHPTPAVCGTPTLLARDLIDQLEPFDRGFYTGAVGWCDARGNGEWAVTLRCGEVNHDSLRLFAGAGIVATSRASDELAETTAKFQTLLRALGVPDLVEE